jgi:uroporphyrinogen-III synthase
MFPSKSEALRGLRVALLESRMGGEMAELVRRHGGIPRHVPSVRESPMDCTETVAQFLNRLETPGPRAIVFLTGSGATALFREADRQARLPSLLESLARATLVCRGPKPSAALKRVGLAATVSAADPYTSREVVEALDHHIDLRDIEVTLVHYGERNETLADDLRARGARLNELCLYQWLLPDDTQPMKDLIQDVMAGEVDAVVFTSQIQGRHLLRIAAEMDVAGSFVAAMTTKVIVAAVGPVCQAALADAGIKPHVVPDNPKMGPLVLALADHCARAARSAS